MYITESLTLKFKIEDKKDISNIQKMIQQIVFTMHEQLLILKYLIIIEKIKRDPKNEEE